MNLTSLPRLGLVGFALAGIAAIFLTRLSAGPSPDAETQPVYLAYTVNNLGYLYTCG